MLVGYNNICLNSNTENIISSVFVTMYRYEGNILFNGCMNIAFITANTTIAIVDVKINFLILFLLKR